MPFRKGVSGNKGGRPKGSINKATVELQKLVRKRTPEVIAELIRLSVTAESESARVAACKELLDRGYGRPPQALQVTGEDGGALVHRVIHDDAD
jgi:hypothetical protein